MLEDPANQDVARWGNDGDTFIIVEVGIESVLASYKSDILTISE